MCWPRFCARLRSSAVRVRIRSRSTSARPPRTAIISRPVLVPVSAHGSARERNCALASTICLTMANSSCCARVARRRRRRRSDRSRVWYDRLYEPSYRTNTASGPATVRSSTRSVRESAPALNSSRRSIQKRGDSAAATLAVPVTAGTHLPGLRGLWARPIEGNVFAGLAIGLPLQPQSVHPMRRGLAPGSHLSGADLRARRV